MKILSSLVLTLCFSTILFAQQQKINNTMKKQYLGKIMHSLWFPDTYTLEGDMHGRGDLSKVGVMEIFELKSSKIDLKKFLGNRVVVTAKKVTVEKSGAVILDIETIELAPEPKAYPDIKQLKNTNWNLVSVAIVNTNGDLFSMPLTNNSANLKFSYGDILSANFCHKIEGTYVFQGKLLFKNVVKKGKNQCTSTEKSPIGTKPNIGSAEDILIENSFDIKIEEKRLILSNSKGELMFERINSKFDFKSWF